MKAGLADSLYQIGAYPHVAEDSPCYYKFFTRVLNYEERYFSSFLGTFESSGYDRARGISVARGIHNTYDGESKFTPYYAAGDTVDVKLCSIDSVAYRFWRAYENSVSLSGNPFFTVAEECRGNIPGALGYWFGYGVARRRVIIGR